MEKPVRPHETLDIVDLREYEAGGKGGMMADFQAAATRAEWADGAIKLSASATTLSTQRPSNQSRRGVGYRTMARGRLADQTSMMLLLVLAFLIHSTSAAFINFQDCLTDSRQASNALQFTPYYVNAVFNRTDPAHNLAVRVWGNVSGDYTTAAVNYSDPDNANGKIVDVPFPASSDPRQTTLYEEVSVLSYTPYTNRVSFCDSLTNGSCPLAPVFNSSGMNPYDLPSIALSHDFYSTYAFTSFTATFQIIYGDTGETPIGCISAIITPDLGETLSNTLKYLPLMVLVLVGFATVFAAIYCPWGTTDIFRWSTNYGRDADLLRLVTPGFGDCLQYIQFVALTGGLTLSYPGFYQPVASKVAWSALMFNHSFIDHQNGTMSLQDGIYFTNATYGLDSLGQLVGMGASDDIWAGMVIWLLVILAAILALIQLGFGIRWVYRVVFEIPEEDLRSKNLPFSLGNVIRIIFAYMLLPIVALSMFQLVVALKSQAYEVALAVILLIIILGFTGWLLYFIASTRPRSFLFDDLPTVLIYGSLYNTYSDNAAPFAIIPLLLTFIRGVAIGAVQPSGIAQLVLLAICEVITILTLHSFRPFHSPTSMNLYHTFFAVCRLISILMMVAFAPSLGVTEGPKGWIGYAILLLHAVVLVFGFFLNACQTIIEVAARLSGAGGDENGATRGGLSKVLGMRQLARRRDGGSRQSRSSTAAILAESDRKSAYLMNMHMGRGRSQSASSNAMLLNRTSMGLEGLGPHGRQDSGTYTPSTPGEPNPYPYLPGAPGPLGRAAGMPGVEAADPYYRPPRARRTTIEALSPAAKTRGDWAEGDWNGDRRTSEPEADIGDSSAERPGSMSGRITPSTPTTGYIPAAQEPGSHERSRSKTQDYTTRESDFYYGVRGPALNANTPGRKLRTGPVDPTGPAASAVGWFQRFLGGKTKEKGKGFEVVRSSRMPPGMRAGDRNDGAGTESPPEEIPEGVAPVVEQVRNGPIDSDDDEDVPSSPVVVGGGGGAASSGGGATHTRLPSNDITDHEISDMSDNSESEEEENEMGARIVSEVPPSLPGLELGSENIELPSRLPSRTSTMSTRNTNFSRKPSLPRKSSKRKSFVPPMPGGAATAPRGLSMIQDTRESVSGQKGGMYDPPISGSGVDGAHDNTIRLPFERSTSQKSASEGTSVDPMSRNPSSAAQPPHIGGMGQESERPASYGFVQSGRVKTGNSLEDVRFGNDLLGERVEVQQGGGSESGYSGVSRERSGGGRGGRGAQGGGLGGDLGGGLGGGGGQGDVRRSVSASTAQTTQTFVTAVDE